MAPGSGKSTTGDLGRPPQGAGSEELTPELFRVSGVVCFGPDKYGVWRYLPEFADVVRDSAGRPMVTLVDVEDAGFLMLTATWAASADELDGLRAAAASRAEEADPTRIRVGSAPLTQVTCCLLVDGTPVESSGTSGTPPYHALFNVPLRGDHLVAVRSVLRGRTDGAVHADEHSVRVQYDAWFAAPQRVKATLAARRGRLRSWLAGRVLDRATLEQAVRTGVASLRIDSSDLEPGPLLDALYQRLLDEVTRTLGGSSRAIGDEMLVTATLERALPLPITAGANVAPA